MKKRSIIAFILFILLTTITSKQEIIISQFNIKEIKIENNSLLETEDIIKSLKPIYNKNLVNLNYGEIEEKLSKKSFIESFNIKKKYPSTLQINIVEKKPIAILQNKKKKYFLSEKLDLIEFNNSKKYQKLPLILGEEKKFKIFYNNLNEINFPLEIINKYTLYDSNRWDIETINQKVIKLPINNYIKSLKNYLNLRTKKNFENYKVFDYRIENQLILK